MADIQGSDPARPVRMKPAGSERGAARRVARRSAGRAATLEGVRAVAEAQERKFAEGIGEVVRKHSQVLRQTAEALLAFAPATAEQVVVEAWDAADVDGRLDALLDRLADTEARLDRQLARLDAGGG